MSKSKKAPFVLRHSFVIRHSCFVIFSSVCPLLIRFNDSTLQHFNGVTLVTF